MDRALANPAQSIETNLSERHHAARASLTSPLVNHRGRQIGIIEVSDKVETDFTPADESNLACFAKIASLAIENACLYHRKADKPSTSVQTRASVSLEMVMGRILAGDAEMRVLLQAGAEAIVRHLGVVLVRVWVSHGGVLELQASAGSSVEHQDQRTRVPVGQFSIGHVARVRRPYVTSCISSDPHLHDKEWAHREGLSAFAGFPLVCGGELLGVLAIYDRKPILPTAFEAVASMSALTAMTILRHRKDDEEIPAVDSITHTLLADFRAEQAVIVTAPNGTIVDWNPAAERSFGYSRPEILGRPIALLVPPDLADEHRNTLAKLADCQTASISETARLCKGGRRINVGLSVSGLRDHSGHLIGAVTVIHDLSEIHRLEQQYRQAQKMGIFGQLAGGIAHDFNNLLTIILGYSEVLIRRLAPTDSLREFVGEIHNASQRAETLTRQLLAYSRKQTLEPKILDLNAVVSDTENMLRRLIGEDILMTTIFSQSLKHIKVDPGHLQQVILNLAVNARDAMPQGGRLTLETSRCYLPGDDGSEREYVVLSVTDTGVGMDEPTKAHLFERLFTTKGPDKGTGLGLATVHGIVRQAGGHVEVASEIGCGSTFKVYFPAVQEPVSVRKTPSGVWATSRGHETVLLVEDDASVRAIVKHVLLTCGYTVLEATHGEEALHLAQSHKEPIHLLVTDVVMPQLSGRSVADRLLALNPELKVLFLSGYTDDAVARHGVLATDFAFLQKPFSTSALSRKVRDVLDQPAQRGGS